MKKRTLTLVLALAVCLGLCVTAMADGTDAVAIYTEEDEYGVAVDSETSGSGAGWSYAADTNVLTLDGFRGHIEVWEGFGPLTIELKGDNTLVPWDCFDCPADQAFSSEDDITFRGGGTLTVIGRLGMFNYTKNPPALILMDGLDAAGGAGPGDHEPVTVAAVRGAYGDTYTRFVTASGEEAVYVTIAPGPVSASPTSAAVLINGRNIAFDAYNINGANYFKLRDLAYVLSGTDKQFEVSYDAATKNIALLSGQAYTAVGGELASASVSGSQQAAATPSAILLDGQEVSLTAYLINGSNYFMLRDIGQLFDFGVDWDAASRTISVDTSKGYTFG